MNPRAAFLRRSMRWQFAVLLAVLALTLSLFMLALCQGLAQGQALQRAKTVANMVDMFGRWAAQYDGIWVRNDPSHPIAVGDFVDQRLLVKMAATDGLQTTSPISTASSYHQKPASLVQRELADASIKWGRGVTFRITSDRFFNPRNAPTRFESLALESFRDAGRSMREFWEVRDGSLRYAKRLVATAACMSCHDTPDKASAALRAQYQGAGGWGYKLGETVGLISVTVPVTTSYSGLLSTWGWPVWACLAGVLGCVIALIVWVRLTVIGSTSELERFARRIVRSKNGVEVPAPLLDEHEASSHNEVHRLSAYLKAITRSLKQSQNNRYGPLKPE